MNSFVTISQFFKFKVLIVKSSNSIKGHMYKMPKADCAITQRKQASIYRMGYRQEIFRISYSDMIDYIIIKKLLS